MLFRRWQVAALALVLIALTATPAAAKNGHGLLGEADDKLVTFLSLGVLLFFTLVAIVGSVIQAWLERRKEEQKAVAARRRAGW